MLALGRSRRIEAAWAAPPRARCGWRRTRAGLAFEVDVPPTTLGNDACWRWPSAGPRPGRDELRLPHAGGPLDGPAHARASRSVQLVEVSAWCTPSPRIRGTSVQARANTAASWRRLPRRASPAGGGAVMRECVVCQRVANRGWRGGDNKPSNNLTANCGRASHCCS